jgi:hypothetical protein
MSTVRVLVGTAKGAFVLTSDGNCEKWSVTGPFFGGVQVYHVKASPVDADRLYASQHTDWHGQIVSRSDDGGASRQTMNNEFVYQGKTIIKLLCDNPPVRVSGTGATGAASRTRSRLTRRHTHH